MASTAHKNSGILFAGTDAAAFHAGMEAPLRILAVDNEPSVTLSFRYVFADPRYDLICVDSGKAALARLEAHSDLFDVIIVDQKMPNLTGLELVGAIRKRGINGRIISSRRTCRRSCANLSSEWTCT